MSALENDLNPDIWIGLSFPLRKDKFNDFKMTKTSLEQSKHNLKNLLLTYPGERVGQPEFGSKLRALCFEQIDDILSVKIEEEIKRSVSMWLPYINIQEIDILTEEGDDNKIHVKLKFTTVLNPQSQEQITLDTAYTATIV